MPFFLQPETLFPMNVQSLASGCRMERKSHSGVRRAGGNRKWKVHTALQRSRRGTRVKDSRES